MDELVVEIAEDQSIELTECDIGVSDDVLSFDVSGTIHGLDSEMLEVAANKQLSPKQIRFEARDIDTSTT